MRVFWHEQADRSDALARGGVPDGESALRLWSRFQFLGEKRLLLHLILLVEPSALVGLLRRRHPVAAQPCDDHPWTTRLVENLRPDHERLLSHGEHSCE